MRTSVEPNHPGFVVHLHCDGDQPAALDNLIVVVVRLRQHRRTGGAKQNAALAKKPVFGAIGRMQRLAGVKRIISFLRRGRERRNSSVGRIHDERRAHGAGDVGSAIGPEVVIGTPRQVGRAAFALDVIYVALFHALLCKCSGFFRGEKLLRAQFLGPLERRDRGVGPRPL